MDAALTKNIVALTPVNLASAARRDHVHLVGVPFNSNGTTYGVAGAPSALRRAGLVEELVAAGLTVNDRGDVDLDPANPARDVQSHVVAVAALGSMVAKVKRAVGESLDDGAFPVVLGGDCPVLLGCLAAAATRGGPGVLFIDGHEDAWSPEQSTTGEAADMELGWLLGRSIDGLPADLRREIPSLDAHELIVLGARDSSELADSGVESIIGLVPIVRPAEIADNPAAVADWAASTLSSHGPWWLHVDLDVLSTEDFPSVDYKQAGGIDWLTLTEVTERAIASPAVLGWTITIYNPDLDPDGGGAVRIIRYVTDSLRSRMEPT